MASITVEHIAKLHEEGLHDSVRSLVSLMLALSEYTNPEKASLQIVVNKYQMLIYYGHALYEDEQYKRAEYYFSEALKLRKTLMRMKSKSGGRQPSIVGEVEVKFWIYQCFMKLRDFRQAVSVLEGISPKQRTPKVNMMLAKLYHKNGMERSAITCYKEVLRSTPQAVEAALSLVDLGVSLQEVNALVNATSLGGVPEWMALYLKGFSFATSNKYSRAIQVYKQLESQTLKDSVKVLCSLGEACWRTGDCMNAVQYYQRVRRIDPACLTGMDIYSQILADESRHVELEKVAQELTQISQIKTEPWVAMANYCACTNRKTRAVYFAQKAHMIDIRNVQALLLKATLLKTLNKQQEALIHYREAIRLAPSFFQPYKGLVECYILAEKLKEAMNIARNALKTVGSNARTFTLCADVYSQDPQTLEKSKALLQKALSCDNTYLPAVYLLSEILMREEDFEGGVELLTKQLLLQRTARLHQLLGDFLKELSNSKEALEHYSKALRLDPNATKAVDGISSLERDATALSDLELSGMGLPSEPRDRSSIEDLMNFE